MKNFLLVSCVFIFAVSGCVPVPEVEVVEDTTGIVEEMPATTEVTELVEDPNATVKGVATEYTEAMDEYVDNAGTDIVITEVLEMACDGCFLVYLEFNISESETGKVKLMFENEEVTDAEFVIE